MGIGQAVYAPAYSSVMPELVDERDLDGAVSLNSVNMNLSRVVGPAIGSLIYARWGVSWVFVGNAVSYLFIIGALLTVVVPAVIPNPDEPQGLRRVLGGFVRGPARPGGGPLPAGHDPVLAVQPGLRGADADAGRSATWASTRPTPPTACSTPPSAPGRWWAPCPSAPSCRNARSSGWCASGWAASPSSWPLLALVRSVPLAFPIVFVVGFFYFATVTSLSTVLQARLDNQVRGRVMALWLMAFGGTVAIGGLIAGPVIDATSVTFVLLLGAVVAAAAGALRRSVRPSARPRPTR